MLRTSAVGGAAKPLFLWVKHEEKILSVVRAKTRRKKSNPVNCFLAESPFQRIRAMSEV